MILISIFNYFAFFIPFFSFFFLFNANIIFNLHDFDAAIATAQSCDYFLAFFLFSPLVLSAVSRGGDE